MSLLDLLLLSVALGMDCFTVSIACGVILRRLIVSALLRIAFLFGLFQALMPALGWMATTRFAHYVEAYDHWLAFALLAFLGLRMIRSSFASEEEDKGLNPRSLTTQLTLSIATSIDALAVGISFACTGYHTFTALVLPLFIIGIGSFLLSLAGHALGLRFGAAIRRRLRPELLGGCILIVIGFRVLLSHLLG